MTVQMIHKTSPRQILIEWANRQQNWVRSIVAEVLATHERLSEETLAEVYEMSLAERGLGNRPTIPVPRLSIEAGDGETIDRLVLEYLKDVRGVNLLAVGQELVFHPRLTVIFGENAVGKSGYVRILKRVAAVRAAERILPNIRLPRPEAPHARIGYRLGEAQPELEWKDEAGVPPFTRLSIFDARAVGFHLDQDLTYVYTPRDLALFPLVAEALQEVKESLSRARDDARPRGNPFLGRFEPGSAMRARLETLGASTDVAALEKLAAIGDDESAGLSALRNRVEALKPQTVAAQLQVARADREMYDRMQKLAALIVNYDWTGRANRLAHIQELERRYRDATENAFAGLDLPGVLTDAWRDFVVAGDEYARTLGHDDYPQATDKCIYCRQDLGAVAVALLRKYHEYCNNTFKNQLDTARRELRALTASLLSTDHQLLAASVSSRVAAAGDEPPPLLGKAVRLAQLFAATQDQIQRQEPVDIGEVIGLATEVRTGAEPALARSGELIADLTKRGEERTRAHAEAQAQLRELEERLALKQLLPEIRSFVERAKWASRADTLLAGPLPQLQRSLTEASKTASEDLLNQDFSRYFGQECDALRAPKVRLEFPGRAGQAQRKKLLTPAHRLSDILSEGEQKVVALADFLAEAAIRTSSAPLVFDDPVTSLDYKRLDYIVDRLVALSAEHQVIVFTHNIWFAMALLSKFESTPHQCLFHGIARGDGDVAGLISRGEHPRFDIPGKIKPRINELIQDAGTTTGETQQALIESAYSRLRSWCEAVAEQELLGGVAQRYQPNVMMTRLKTIHVDRLQAAIDVISRIFDKCCRITDAHSQPLETLHVRPSLTDLKQDWDEAQQARDAYVKGN